MRLKKFVDLNGGHLEEVLGILAGWSDIHEILEYYFKWFEETIKFFIDFQQ